MSAQKGVATPPAQGVARGHERGQRLTASRVPALPAGDHTDPGCQGLQLRVREKASGASRTWLYRYRWRGEWVRLTIGHYPGTDLAEARDLVVGLRKKIAAGIDPRRAMPRRNPEAPALPARGGNRHSIEYLVSEFVERHLRTTRKKPEYAQRALELNVLTEWKGRDARTIEPREVIDLLDKIVDRGARVMANRVAGLLGQLFKFGIHRAIVETSPVQLLYRPGGKEKPRDRALDDDELAALLTHLDDVCRSPRTAAVLRILLLTGQRRGELTAARWVNVDLKAKTWTIPAEDSKTGVGHVVPLSTWAVSEFELLKRLAGKSAFVVPVEDGSAPADPKLVTRSVARCLTTWKKHGVAAWTPHDLRRTCRTGLSRLKDEHGRAAVPPHIAERVLNHAQDRIAGTYDTHSYLDEKRDALEKWATHLQSLASAP
jgi:integrase